MKKNFLTVIIGMLSLVMSMNSCSSDDEDETDSRDQYVGAWNLVSEGSINRLEDGSILDTESANETKSVNVSKSGEKDLVIDGDVYFVSVDGLFLTSTPIIDSGSDGSYIYSITYSTIGTLSVDNFTLLTTVTGTWTDDDRNGTFSGTVSGVLTK
jgi:hypothetical protein